MSLHGIREDLNFFEFVSSFLLLSDPGEHYPTDKGRYRVPFAPISAIKTEIAKQGLGLLRFACPDSWKVFRLKNWTDKNLGKRAKRAGTAFRLLLARSSPLLKGGEGVDVRVFASPPAKTKAPSCEKQQERENSGLFVPKSKQLKDRGNGWACVGRSWDQGGREDRHRHHVMLLMLDERIIAEYRARQASLECRHAVRCRE